MCRETPRLRRVHHRAYLTVAPTYVQLTQSDIVSRTNTYLQSTPLPSVRGGSEGNPVRLIHMTLIRRRLTAAILYLSS